MSFQNWAGSILAVGDSVTNTAGDIDGSVTAASVTQNNELHDADVLVGSLAFVPTTTSIVEPGSLALLASGLVAFGLVRRRKTGTRLQA